MKYDEEMHSGRRTRINATQIVMFVILVGLGLAFALGSLTASNPERQMLAIQEAAAVQPWKIASRITGYLVFGIVTKVAAFVLGGYALFYLLAIGRNWLDLRARQIHARDGLFPVIEVQKGALYDPNRDNAGAHPVITLASLEVQRTAAMKADKILIKQTDSGRPVTSPTVEAAALASTLPDMVRLADVLHNPSLESLIVGLSDRGLVRASLHDLMHVLAVGASGFGKSAFLGGMIYQLAQVPEPVEVVAIDINGSEFNPIRDWDRLRYPVARDTQTAIATLEAVRAEIARRKELYERYPTACDLPSYNQQADDELAPIVILTDEGTNLLNQDGIGAPLREVTQTARQYGVYLLLAGQSATHAVIPTQTRDNFSTRLCFHTSPASRRVVLGESVDDVTVRGRAWVSLSGSLLQQVQVPYVSHEEMAQVISMGRPKQTIDLESHIPAAADDDIAQRVWLLHARGASDTAIAREVFRYGNPHYIAKVREILQQQHGVAA